jgi:hypothetical protein
MSRRRGFGNVRKLPSGRWQARYWLPGGGHLAAPGGFPTKAEANRWLATVEADRARGLWVDPRAGRMRLEEYAATWLDSKVGISPRTREI